jgi:LPS sulfotransferase NodH/MoaA/NifB/PqqE/SkfB family radical SAM enzyme
VEPKNIANQISDICSNQVVDIQRIQQLETMPEPRSKYIIAMTPHSGSSFLCDVMKHTKRFGRPDESLNHVAAIINNIPARTPDEYIHNVIHFKKTPNGVSGLKVDWFRFERFVQSMSDKEYLKGFKFIYLTRRDRAAQAVSLYRATATSIWHTNVQHDADVLNKAEILEYDFEAINKCYENIATQEKGWQKYFLDNGITPLCISYEEIETDVLNTMKRIASHVSVRAENVSMPKEQSAFTKVSDHRNGEWALRFEFERHSATPNSLAAVSPQVAQSSEKFGWNHHAKIISNRFIGIINSMVYRGWLGLNKLKRPSRRSAINTRFHLHKAKAIESFIRFSKGKEFPEHPLTMIVEVSNLCDLQCAMCITFSAINPARKRIIKNKKRGFFDIQEISKIKPYLESALQVHAFGFGEPMIHPDFLAILDVLKSYEVMVDFYTNGMHLTEENCRAIVDYRVAAITISFSGTTKEEYENVYIKGNFDTVLEGIRRLAAYKRQCRSPYPRIEINSLGFQHHVNSLPEFVKMMGQAGVNVIFLKPLHAGGIPFIEPFVAAYRQGFEGKIIEEAKAVAKEMGVHLCVEVFQRDTIPNDANVGDFVRRRRGPLGKRIKKQFPNLEATSVIEIKELARELKQRGAFWKQIEPTNEMRAKTELMGMKQHNLLTPCFEPFKTLYIHVNGDARPCCFADSRTATIGNVFDDGINVWGNAPFLQIKHGVLNGQYPIMCDYCISVHNAPSNHDINCVVEQYYLWYQNVFGATFSVDAAVGASKLPDNRGILNAWKKRSIRISQSFSA